MTVTFFSSVLMNFGVLIFVSAIVCFILNHIKPSLLNNKKFTKEQLLFLESIVRQGVIYSEQLYKKDSLVDRNLITLNYVHELMERVGISYEENAKIIKGLIEVQVFKLPQTHKIK